MKEPDEQHKIDAADVRDAEEIRQHHERERVAAEAERVTAEGERRDDEARRIHAELARETSDDQRIARDANASARMIEVEARVTELEATTRTAKHALSSLDRAALDDRPSVRELEDEIARRLQPICSHIPSEEFLALVRKMAEVQYKYDVATDQEREELRVRLSQRKLKRD
jgi:hypothetical protein